VAASLADGGTPEGHLNSYGSADANRFTVSMFTRAATNNFFCIALERTKDAAGADIGTGCC
jgi:hypothetical protein